MSDESTICPILTEFRGWPGFPSDESRAERYSYVARYRLESFREALDTITLAAGDRFGPGTVHPIFMRYAAALVALTSYSYEQAPEPESAPPDHAAEAPESEIPL